MQVSALKVIPKAHAGIVHHVRESISRKDRSENFFFVSTRFGRVLACISQQLARRPLTSITNPGNLKLAQQRFNDDAHFGEVKVNVIFQAVSGDNTRYIDLSISDNGIGFVKQPVKTKKRGGLCNIARNVELFNNTIKMITAPGNGCRPNIRISI